MAKQKEAAPQTPEPETAAPETLPPSQTPPVGAIAVIYTYGDAFARAGDHTLHAQVQEVALAGFALKQRIAAVSSKIPADLAAALMSIDAVL